MPTDWRFGKSGFLGFTKWPDTDGKHSIRTACAAVSFDAGTFAPLLLSGLRWVLAPLPLEKQRYNGVVRHTDLLHFELVMTVGGAIKL